MAITPATLLAELVLSADRLTQAAAVGPAPAPGQWPPQVVLGHIAAVDRDNWSRRVALMANAHRAGQPPPELAWFEPPAEQTEQEFGGMTVTEASGALMSARIALVAQVRNLGPGDWQARARHSVFGELDITGLLLRLLAHDEEHRAALLQVAGDGNLSP